MKLEDFSFPGPMSLASGLTGVNNIACNNSITVHGHIIAEPSIIPLCALAAAIGVLGFVKAKQTGKEGSLSYSFTFLMYAFMMTAAMITDSLTNLFPGKLWNLIIPLLDASLTSSIAFAFSIDGLVDVGIMEDGIWSVLSILIAIIVFFIAWFIVVVTGHLNDTAFLVLYIAVIIICCGAYAICQLVFLYRNGLRGSHWLLLGIVAGSIGFSPLVNNKAALYFCSWLGPKLSPTFGPEFIWFLGSDFAVWLLVLYFVYRNAPSKKGLSSSSSGFQLVPATAADL